MALKPTIYKFNIALSDLNRNYYDTLHLTVAQHPSENSERMMTRILACCLNAQENLTFTKGLSAIEEPDLWVHSLDDQLLLWIDIGEPALDRIKKATRQAQATKVYTFNSKSDVWWEQNKNKLQRLNVSIYQFQWQDIQSLATLVERTMECSVTITGNSAYIATALGECEIPWRELQP
ncbi:YaeQ protein [hydrothermal vent metagenome]|uniref:YaeQ protein n=1 Tax=hydrothermal vent metagenome TaxID=652676 RepID=A0A3B0WJF4_9ZZZZ